MFETRGDDESCSKGQSVENVSRSSTKDEKKDRTIIPIFDPA